MNHPNRIALFILILLGSHVSAMAQQDTIKPPKKRVLNDQEKAIAGNVPFVSELSKIKLFRLKNIAAEEALKVISTLEVVNLRLSADETTNSIIAMGSLETLDWLEAVLMRLDQQQGQPPVIKVFRLGENGHSYVDIVSKIIQDSDTRLAVTEDGKKLIVSSDDPSSVDQIASLLESVMEVKEEKQKVASKNCRVRVTWLVDGADLSEPLKGSKPSKSLSELCDYFEQSRDFLLRTATMAESVIQLTDQSRKPASFSTSSSSKIDNSEFVIRLQSSVAETEDGKVQLSLDLRLNESDAVSTMLAVPMNHPVAFSVTDVDGLSSVIVLEVEPIE